MFDAVIRKSASLLKIEYINISVLSALFSDVLDKENSNDIPAIQKAKTLYKSCINESKFLHKSNYCI